MKPTTIPELSLRDVGLSSLRHLQKISADQLREDHTDLTFAFGLSTVSALFRQVNDIDQKENAVARAGTEVKIFSGLAVLMLVVFVGAMTFILTRPEPPPPSQDLYTQLQLGDFSLVERSGRIVGRAEVDGKIVIVGFVFTSCGIDCKIAGQTMAKIQAMIGEREDLRMISLTVDPLTDTTEVLRKFASNLGADDESWLFLTGEKEEIFDLVDKSFLAVDEGNGLKVMPVGRLPLVGRLYVLDRSGRIRGLFKAKAETTPSKIMALVKEITTSQPIREIAAAKTTEKVYAARGLIREIAPDQRTAIIRHEEIPGYMPEMTMKFNIGDTNELRNLRAGDEITFKLVATDETHWIRQLNRTAATIELSGEDLKVFESHPVPVDAQIFPDFEFLSEQGKVVRLSDYEGRALVFTFIFTRCPLPDYCPRMGKRFFEARKILRAGLSGPTNWNFLSISFDPEFDTPELLGNYGGIYRGNDSDRWLFAVASQETLNKIAPLCDLQLMKGGGSITHNLRTLVLTPQRAIHRVFAGNTWSAAELANALTEAAKIQ